MVCLMKPVHPQQAFLKPPAWADPTQPSTAPSNAAIDCSALSAVLPPRDEVLAAARAVDLTSAPDPGAQTLRQAAAAALGVDGAQIFPGAGHRAIFRLLCRAFLAPGDRVLIAEPTYTWVTEEILAVGAAYIDAGRDQHMCVQTESFARVLRDQPVRMVFLSDPNPLSGVTVDEALWSLVNATDALWVVDATWRSATATVPEGVATLRDLGLQAGVAGIDAGILLADAETIATCWQVGRVAGIDAAAEAAARAHLGAPDAFDRALNDVIARHAALGAALEGCAYTQVTQPMGPGLMAGIQGLQASAVAEQLIAQGLAVRWSRAHTWHDRVTFHLPASVLADDVLAAWRGVG